MELSFRIKFSLCRKLSGFELPAISNQKKDDSNPKINLKPVIVTFEIYIFVRINNYMLWILN
ncbi:hypothetical protein E0F76_11995 [Flavobacterium cellulosilyticum]|uniref:Uncharacterized protein n=1 Tax=Flavobacterium cellulosilyticum TaxID=2541731 RepID=A0A4R5C8N4_9FLAO|nr:hypothetical protein E0F76_11995 [Flavobacterium cellulosilyticum]